MPTVLDLTNRYNVQYSAKAGRNVPTTTGKLGILPGQYTLQRDGMTGAFSLANAFGTLPGSTLAAATAATNATTLETLHFANHLHVKTDLRWRRMYHYKNRPFRFKRANGNYITQQLPSFPCHYCGIYLPEEFIEVDHRQPQASPGSAIIKVLRSINAGYTGGASVGTKAGQIADLEANNVGVLNTVDVSEYDWNVAWQAGVGFMTPRAARYTLSSQGQTFLTICCMLWGSLAVEKRCLNSIINLVPACRMCNGAQGKGSKLYAVQ
ncbi:hypothetical protein [Fibrella forsythiae]|uniref:Uncharacterized protein n=1 Tax=Fibrella forsythiae TaxID=2817061 RepID=A0ABS3JE48_9BACT|nr:hypothetical protein [Fibrella forsythiae]MBO0947132.1 hypothetical protein [Fibrella forsythiae]